ncbi:MAG: dehypoxanthine futalosine cyclase [Myxococcales bacterium]|nr:dehypoxanthine futalosine cyclase [Myxococcales bacterium]
MPAQLPSDTPSWKVACVGYTNAWPLTRHLPSVAPGRFEVLPCVPSEAARLLRTGEADVGLVPVAALFNDDDYRIIPGFCIGCDGDVQSVLLVGETPPEQWESVALDGESRTSVVLAQILLRGPLLAASGQAIRVFPVDAGTGAFHAQGKTGAVVIGDAARNLPDRLTTRIDLGRIWKEWTGLPFVFAVWAGRPGLDPEAIAGIREAGRRGMPDRLTAPEADRAYLTEAIRYELDDSALMGLRRFAALGKRAGLLARDEVCLYGPATTRSRPGAASLDTLLARGSEGGRLSLEEGVRLETEARLEDLGNAAHLRRLALHPTKEVTYIISRNVNYTNICVTACKFCAFYRPKNHAEAYVLTKEQLHQKISELEAQGGIEVLLQGGLNLNLGIAYYEDLFRWIKTNYSVALHALSPEEIFHIMAVSKLTMEDTLDRLIAAGMDSIPGGGAEVLNDDVRKRIAPLKCTSDEWLAVMRLAHRRGLRSTSTLMFGVGETSAHRMEHLVRLRDLQDEYHGFTAFICWTFVPDNTYVQPGNNTATAYLRTNAVSRLMLDNFDNIQASWVTQGPGVAQASLTMGCNDFGSVMLEENVVSAAGSTWAMTIDDVEHNIRTAGFTPVRRNMRYDHLPTPSGLDARASLAAPAK